MLFLLREEIICFRIHKVYIILWAIILKGITNFCTRKFINACKLNLNNRNKIKIRINSINTNLINKTNRLLIMYKMSKTFNTTIISIVQIENPIYNNFYNLFILIFKFKIKI